MPLTAATLFKLKSFVTTRPSSSCAKRSSFTSASAVSCQSVLSTRIVK